MAYPNYVYPQYYPPVQQSIMPLQTRQPGMSVAYVQGENAAKAYPFSSGQTIYLFDTETNLMYIKSTDQSGIPLPLRIFEYSEKIPGTSKESTKQDSVSREEFDKFKEEMRNELKRRRRPEEPVKETRDA